MSREQKIYLADVFVQWFVMASLGPTFGWQENGLGTRCYAVLMVISFVGTIAFTYASADVVRKRWLFEHYKAVYTDVNGYKYEREVGTKKEAREILEKILKTCGESN